MSIRVIGAGLGRTGAASLKGALECLGFDRCYHMIELFTHPEHVEHWERASADRPVDWDALYAGYQACVDYPGCRYYRQLMARYPQAKVILTVRDPETWYESARETIYQVSRRHLNNDGPPKLPFPGDPQLLGRIFQMIQCDIWQGDFGGKFEDRDHAISVFNRHTEAVKASVPPERLLVYEVQDGWEPLCRFLGVPVPETSFPRFNDRAEFVARLARRSE